jgi:predicted transcriptional regulator
VDASDTAAIVVAVASGVALLVLVWAALRMARTLRELQGAVAELQSQTFPVVTEMRAAVEQAQGELARMDAVLGTAENITNTVDSASRLAYLAFSNPVIKVLAFAAGTSRAARKFRRGKD